MKKILIYENRKTDPIYWDYSTFELQKKAMLDLFKILDESWDIFCEIKEKSLDDPERMMYDRAKLGNPVHARNLLIEYNDDEYISWDIRELENVDHIEISE